MRCAGGARAVSSLLPSPAERLAAQDPVPGSEEPTSGT